jgi:hypothetical protein
VKKYSETISETNKSFSTCLKTYEPKLLENNIIEIPIDNSTLDDKSLLRSLTDFLRRETKNPQIWVKVVMTATPPVIARPAKPEDKYRDMLEKNPELGNFVRQLNLELDI